MARIGNAVLDARYEVLKLIDTGGTSQVYLVLDRRLNCQWAIKKTAKAKSQAVNTVISEANILKSLSHPALPRIVDIQEDEDYFYIVMDYIQGETLRTILRTDGPQPQDSVVAWGVELCDVLSYLHSKGIIYRDMKPANVMLTPEGKIKLIDFGIARVYNPNAREDTVPLGTEGYAAPEQYEGHGQSDERTDVFGVGVTLFQLLTNINPVTYSENTFSIRLANPMLSSGLDKIILRCTNRSREKRYSNTEELKKALLDYRKLDNEYIKKERKQKNKTCFYFALSTACFILAIGSFILNLRQADNMYSRLLTDKQNPKSIAQAIELKPANEEGYIALLESYGQELDSNELTDFSHIFAEYGDKLPNQDEVNIAIGERILSYYTDNSLRSRLLLSEPYFSAVSKNSKKYSAAQAYVKMANFYKNYILQSDGALINEATEKEYLSLLDNMKKIIDTVSRYKGSEQKNLLLTSCELCLNIISDQCNAIHEQGIPANSVNKIINLISEKTSQIDSKASVINDKKERVLKQIPKTKLSIKEAYSPKNKKGGK